MMKECRNDLVASGETILPRSCPRCGLGPCNNLNNKIFHETYLSGSMNGWEHEPTPAPKDKSPLSIPEVQEAYNNLKFAIEEALSEKIPEDGTIEVSVDIKIIRPVERINLNLYLEKK